MSKTASTTPSTIQPLDNRVVVKPDTPSTSMASGLMAPEQDARMPRHGTVIVVGPGRVLDDGHRLKPCVRVGDSILFEPDAGREVVTDGGNLLILRESEILARTATRKTR